MVDFDAIQALAKEILTIVGTPLLNLLVAMVLLIVGLWLARTFHQATSYVLGAVGFDRITDAIGVTKALKSGGVKHRPAELMGHLVYWIVMLGSLVKARPTRSWMPSPNACPIITNSKRVY